MTRPAASTPSHNARHARDVDTDTPGMYCRFPCRQSAPPVASSTSSPEREDRTVSNRTLTDLRAPRLLDGRVPARYLAQHALLEQQRDTTLELDTLS